MNEMMEEYRFMKDWSEHIRKATQGKFCSKHHSHRYEDELIQFIDLLLKYQKTQGIPDEDKVGKLRNFIDVLDQYEPEVDFTVVAFCKAVEMDRCINDKPNEIIRNYEKKKLQYRLGKNCQKNMALHKLVQLSELTETMENICRL